MTKIAKNDSIFASFCFMMLLALKRIIPTKVSIIPKAAERRNAYSKFKSIPTCFKPFKKVNIEITKPTKKR